MNSSRSVRIAVPVTLLIFAFVALLTAPAAHAQGDAGFEPGEVDAGRALLAHVPGDLRVHCSLNEVFHKIPVPDGVVARIDCDQLPRTLGADSLTYYQYKTLDAMNADYDVNRTSTVTTPLADCAPDAPYSVGGQQVGRSACLPDPLGATIVYTYEPLRVVGIIRQFNDDAGNVDVAALNNFSNHRAGPDATAGTIPSRLTGAQARRAAIALRGHLPPALRAKCSTQSVDATPWVSASLACRDEAFPGVLSLNFTSSRTAEAFKSAFDPKAIVASSQARNATCPDSGTWSSSGHVRGRFACTYDRAGNTTLTWTLDSHRITAQTRTYQMTSKQFLTWWDQHASLTR